MTQGTQRLELTVDCGLRGCGCALWDGNELLKAEYVKNSERKARGALAWWWMSRAVWHWAGVGNDYTPKDCHVETMQIYGRHKSAAKPADILEIQGVAGAIVGACYGKVASSLPRQWKGTLDGDMFTNRIIAQMYDFEKKRVVSVGKSVDHNTYDAIGIGLYKRGRLSSDLLIFRK